MQQISLECVTSRSLLGRPRDYALIAFNFVGAIVYVCLASRAWTIPRERGLHSATAEPFIWFLSVAPIVAIFFVVNVYLGRAHSSPPTVAKWIFVAVDGADLAGRCSD
jgi:hypothetical protein